MGGIRTGKHDVDTTTLGHTKGVRQGNAKGNYESQSGHDADGHRTAESSTGVNAKAHDPIDPRMPNLPPA
jgi:hypothetical protein